MTLVFNDYETFNLSPLGGAPSQYAAIKTDLNFNRVSVENFFCLPSQDIVPEFQACLVTKHTPESVKSEEKSYCEYDFVSKIHNYLTSDRNTIVVGYNSLRFDDEWNRHLFYRNLFPAYEWHFKNGNSRYDAMLLMQAVYGLRPNLLKWHYVPVSENSDETRASMKLEHLSAVNGIVHENAHDALSDVDALISLMKRVKEADPEFYDLALSVRDKSYVLNMLLAEENKSGLLYISQYERQHNFVGYIIPLFQSVEDKNIFWAWDAKVCPEKILSLPEDVKCRLLSLKKDELDSLGIDKKGLVKLKINALPNLFPKSVYSKELAGDNGLSEIRETIRVNSLKLLELVPQMKELVSSIEANPKEYDDRSDYDMRLYTDGFMTPAENAFIKKFHSKLTWEERYGLVSSEAPTERTKALAMRVIGRNSPEALNEVDSELWEAYVAQRMLGNTDNSPQFGDEKLSANNQILAIEKLLENTDLSECNVKVLTEIKDYYHGFLE
ncbi:TPA: exodeoxyribonuclease I [Vibrio parahaemolyticus]